MPKNEGTEDVLGIDLACFNWPEPAPEEPELIELQQYLRKELIPERAQQIDIYLAHWASWREAWLRVAMAESALLGNDEDDDDEAPPAAKNAVETLMEEVMEEICRPYLVGGQALGSVMNRMLVDTAVQDVRRRLKVKLAPLELNICAGNALAKLIRQHAESRVNEAPKDSEYDTVSVAGDATLLRATQSPRTIMAFEAGRRELYLNYPVEARAVTLYHYCEFEEHEIAALAEVPVTTATKWLDFGIKAIRDIEQRKLDDE